VDEWHKQNFARLSDPSAEARYDIPFFFSKYFVDAHDLPVPNKTPEPIILWDMHNLQAALHRRVNAIPGLSARITQNLTVIAWAAQFEKAVDTVFAMINSVETKLDRPTLEACFDPDRFVAKYFLDGMRGKPAPWKQATPLIVKYWITHDDGLKRLSRAAEHVPDLMVRKTAKLGRGGIWSCSETCVIVGWSKQVISQDASWKSSIAQLEELEAKQKAREKEKEILAKVKPHLDYARAHRPPPPVPPTLNHLVGSYIMHCRQLQYGYGCELGSMSLDIHAPTSTHGAVAAFNFGLVQGTMLLATSEESLERLREEQAVRLSDGEEEEDSEVGYYADSRKRKVKTESRLPSVKQFKRRLGSDQSQNSSRFHLQWAGCETSNSYLVLDEDHERTGHFDLDKTGMAAQGEFWYHAYYKEPLVFTLLKVADKPIKEPDAWSSYCEKDRWIHW
jgi:hypothetical protein